MPSTVATDSASASRLASRLNAFEIDCRTSAAGPSMVTSTSSSMHDDARDVAGHELGLGALVVERGEAGQRDRPVLDRGVDRRRDRRVEHQRLQHGAAHVGVVAPVAVEQSHAELAASRRASGRVRHRPE